MEDFKNLEIGNTFELGGIKIRVVENKNKNNPCGRCYFDSSQFDCYTLCDSDIIPECNGVCRTDKKDVIFEEVKK